MANGNHTARRFVWRSTDGSIRDGTISLLALAEIPFALILYFYIVPQWFGYWTPVIVSTIAAPLLLLRSEASVRRAVAMWVRYAERPGSDKLAPWEWVLVIGGVVILSGGIAWWLTEAWLITHEGWALYWRAFLVGILCFNIGLAVAVAVGVGLAVGVEEKEETMAVGIQLGLWLRSVFVRAASILRTLSAGFTQISGNWRHAMLCEDFCHTPELIPGARALGLDLRGAKETEGSTSWADAAMLLAYPFAILWRLALKSTFWLYGPALFIVHPGNLIKSTARKEWLTRKKYAWERLIFWTGLGVFLFTVLTLIDLGDLSALWRESKMAGVPFDLLTWSLALDLNAFLSQPWRWFSFANLLCALGVFFWRDAIAKRLGNGESIAMQGWPVGALVRLARAQLLFFAGYWLLSIYYFVPFMVESGRAPDWLIANWPF